MTARPLIAFAYIAWGIGAVTLAGGITWFFRAALDEEGRRRAAIPIALITLAALSGLFGTAAYFAKSGELAASDSGGYITPSGDMTTTLSPIPTAPAAPVQAEQTPEADSGEFAVVDIGFEEIGSVAIGGSKSKIEATFGKPAAIVETVAPDGKAAEAHAYEGKREFTIFVRDSKVRAYVVRAPGFVTFSGVSVGDSLEKAKSVYGTKLKTESEDVYALSGPRSTSLRIHAEDGKVTRIEGGLLG